MASETDVMEKYLFFAVWENHKRLLRLMLLQHIPKTHRVAL
jgi:hypothetical protein